MTILEPRRAWDDEHPVVDLALGLQSLAERWRTTLDRIAPAVAGDIEDETSAPAEAHVLLLLGLVATSERIQELVAAMADASAPPAPIAPQVTEVSSLWR